MVCQMLNILLYLIFSFSLLNLPVLKFKYRRVSKSTVMDVYEERNDSRFVSLFLFDCQSRDC